MEPLYFFGMLVFFLAAAICVMHNEHKKREKYHEKRLAEKEKDHHKRLKAQKDSHARQLCDQKQMFLDAIQRMGTKFTEDLDRIMLAEEEKPKHRSLDDTWGGET